MAQVDTSVSFFHSLTRGLLQMNQFHWHIVDSQSFPLVVPGFTDLSAKGAYSAAEVYTAENVADVVAYANAVSYP
jgi:hexosaminidase